MKFQIRKFDINFKLENAELCCPLYCVVDKKIYFVDSWQELFKLLMYSYCYKKNRMQLVYNETNKNYVNKGILITDSTEESEDYVKFSPSLYVRVFDNQVDNLEMLQRIKKYTKARKLTVYLLVTNEGINSSKTGILRNTEIINEISKLAEQNGWKNGSTRRKLNYADYNILNEEERFYRHIEREFDNKNLLGDIQIQDTDEQYLVEYMHRALYLAIQKKKIKHEKVFAFGLVYIALLYYSNRTYWPFVAEKYGVSLTPLGQRTVNERFRAILQKNNKLYDNDTKNYVQNICMHAFICNRCTNQLFDYLFNFWKKELSRNIENIKTDEDKDLFNILINQLITNNCLNIPDVMMHTIMALKLNTRGCKIRIRRILRMIDDSFWNNSDYSNSKNRISILFNEWKKQPKGIFIHEYQQAITNNHSQRKKLHFKPTIIIDRTTQLFKIEFPKQILINCSEDEYLKWKVTINNKEYIYPVAILKGQAFIYTEKISRELKEDELFEQITFTLSSDKKIYYKNQKIPCSEVRFFDSLLNNIEQKNGVISNVIKTAYVKKGKSISSMSNRDCLSIVDKRHSKYDLYSCELENGDVLTLPDQSLLSIGKPIQEGLIGSGILNDVSATYLKEDYAVSTKRSQIFIKCDKAQIKGTLIRILKERNLLYSGKIDKYITEFKLSEHTNVIYGYIIDLNSFIHENGVYKIEVNTPPNKIRNYHICYIEGFNFSFDKSPYVFDEVGSILAPSIACYLNNSKWVYTPHGWKYKFNISDLDQKHNCLKVNFYLNRIIRVTLNFFPPVLYWKYSVSNDWNYKHPKDLLKKDLPERIFIKGFNQLNSIKMFVKEHDYESMAALNYDSVNQLHYFRTLDFLDYLDSSENIKNLMIKVDQKNVKFATILCKTIVLSRNINCDYENNCIVGEYDILGYNHNSINNDFCITIKYNKQVIAEDIPLNQLKFIYHWNIEDGEYEVTLYENQEDDSGFFMELTECDSVRIDFKDPYNISGKKLLIKGVRSENNNRLLNIRKGYSIRKLRKVNFDQEILDLYDICSWRYDTDDIEQMRKLSYYHGVLGMIDRRFRFKSICEVIVIFDNQKNKEEGQIYVISENELNPIAYHTTRRLFLTESTNSKNYLIVLDDDIYRFQLKVED